MEIKPFKSRLFNKIINSDNSDYWIILYAEILHRLRVLEDRFCACHFCTDERDHLNSIIKQMEKDGHIQENPKPRNAAKKGYCIKILEEDSAKFSTKLSAELIIPGTKQQSKYKK